MNNEIPINYSPMKGIKTKSTEYEKVLFTSILLAQATSKFIDFEDEKNTKLEINPEERACLRRCSIIIHRASVIHPRPCHLVVYQV